MGEAVSPVAGAAGDLVQISQAKISDQADSRPSECRVTASKYQDLFYNICFHGTIFTRTVNYSNISESSYPRVKMGDLTGIGGLGFAA